MQGIKGAAAHAVAALFTIVTVAATVAGIAGTAGAADVTLRMRGGTFEVKGELKSFDLKRWIVTAPGLGTLSLDAARYECVSEGCPTKPTSSQPVLRYPARAVDTTWMGGSGIGTDYMPRLVRAYAQAVGASVAMEVASDPKNLVLSLTTRDGRPVGRVIVARQGVPPGFAGMARGEVDVVWTSRPIWPEEQQMMTAAGVADMTAPDNQHVFGLDAMVVLVSRENPVVSMSLDTIAQIFAGKITDWSELGLPPGRITVYAPTAEMGLWSYFESAVMRPRGLAITADAVRLLHATEWSDKVAADPGGIGINFFAYIRKAKPVNVELTCGIVMPPSIFAAKNEEYPLARRLYFYTKGAPKNPLAAALLSFALSPRGQAVLKDAQFVDQEPELAPFSAHTGRIAVALNAADEDFDPKAMTRLIEEIRGASRATLTYRFAIGGATLDSRANEDVSRLAELIKSPQFAGKSVMLIGFSDAIGRFDANLALARKRAQVVRGALAKVLGAEAPAGVRVVDTAYGELAPVACNDSLEGRALNRRVEVWVR
ncbi:MAG: phosphate ABC transporter substrate-binding/OmpA family protein [Hyphomicrobiaceae bacterium]